MFKKFILVFLLFILTIPSLAFANSINVDLTRLNPDVAKELIANMQQMNNNNIYQSRTIDSDNIEKYASMGKQVAIALKELCNTLNVQVNAFAKTPVGKITIALLFWKLAGQHMMDMLWSAFILFFASGLILFSFSRFHLPYREVSERNEKGKAIKYRWKTKYEFPNRDYAAFSAGVHVVLFVVIIVTSLNIIN